MNRAVQIAKLLISANSGGRQWLATLRIGAGLLLIAKVISEWSCQSLLYSSHGFIPSHIAAYSTHPLIPSLSGIYHYAASRLSEIHFLHLYFGLALIAGCLLVAGYHSRFTSILCWLLAVITVNSSHLTSYGFDAMLIMMLFYCMIFPVGPIYSSDRHEYTGIYHKTIQLHVCIIYLVNAICKINGPAWHDGSGLWDMVHQPQFASVFTPLLIRILAVPHLASFAGMAIVILELLFPILIWIRPVQRPMLLLIIALHISIALIMGLWLFAAAMILLDLTAFGVVLRRH